jgi:methylmalonyl-CoA mutase
MGGLQKALETGFVQKSILDVANARRKAVATRTDVIVGINQYPNALEEMPEPKTIDHAAIQTKLGPKASAARAGQAKSKDFGALVDAAPKSTLGEISLALGRSGSIKVEPLVSFRTAELFETLRKAMAKARKGKTDVFLANLGPVGAYMPRLDFTRAFFQVGGFSVEDKSWFNTPEEAAKAAQASGAPIIVAVGLDDTYVGQIPELAKALKAGGAKKVLVAGLLKEHSDAFKASGIDDFVHIKSDVHAVLSGLAKDLGVIQ